MRYIAYCFLYGCSVNIGAVPIIGQKDNCIKIVVALDNRAKDCGFPNWKGIQLKSSCKDSVGFDIEQEQCMKEIANISCDKFPMDVGLPSSCDSILIGN